MCGYRNAVYRGLNGAHETAHMPIGYTPQLTSDDAPARTGALRRFAPGLLLCLVAVVIALAVNALLPSVSPLIVAIVLGIALTNAVRLPESTSPGIALASKSCCASASSSSASSS